jgi:hypothetical protein
MPTLSSLQNQAGELATSAKGLSTTPINAEQAAQDGTQVTLNPGMQSASLPQSGNFNFSGTPTAPAATPLPSNTPVPEPAVATGGEQPALPATPGVSPNGPLATQLANQPQGTIEDSVAAAQAAAAGTPRPPQPNVINPADPNKLPEVNPEDLPKKDLTDPTAWAHV